MANQDIKNEIKKSGLKQWEVAAELGFADSNFSRLLRFELQPEKKERIQGIITKLRAKKSETVSL